MNKSGFIGVIDSGIGGLSVLNELLKILPNENYIYYADIKNCPYGEKTSEEIQKLTFATVNTLVDSGAKAIVIACNTATGSAVAAIREKYDKFPIIGIEPAIKPAVTCLPGQNIAVLATPLTIKQEKFKKLYTAMSDSANVIPIPCPNLASLIENNFSDKKLITDYLYNVLRDFLPDKLDGIVLGCTHFTFIKNHILALLPNVKLFDGNEGTAKQTKHLLDTYGLTADRKIGNFEIMTSGNQHNTAEFNLKSIHFLNLLK